MSKISSVEPNAPVDRPSAVCVETGLIPSVYEAGGHAIVKYPGREVARDYIKALEDKRDLELGTLDPRYRPTTLPISATPCTAKALAVPLHYPFSTRGILVVAAPPALERTFAHLAAREPDLDGPPRGTSFSRADMLTRSAAAVRAIISGVQAAQASSESHSFIYSDVGALEDACVQSGASPAWSYILDGLGLPFGETDSESYRRVSSILFPNLVAAPKGIWLPPVHSFCSYPTGESGPYAKLAHAIIAEYCTREAAAGRGTLYSNYLRVAGAIGDVRGFGPDPYAVMLTRTGKKSGNQVVCDLLPTEFDGGAFRVTGVTSGALCERRVVNATSTALSMIVSRHYAGLAKLAQYKADDLESDKIPLWTTLPPEAVARMVEGFVSVYGAVMFLIDDLSKMDKTVRGHMQTNFSAGVLRPVLPPQVREVWDAMEALPTIGPGVGASALLYTKGSMGWGDGDTQSGILPTSFVQSCHNSANCIDAVAAGLDVSPEAVVLMMKLRRLLFFINGDDTMVLLRPQDARRFDVDAYKRARARSGFKSKPQLLEYGHFLSGIYYRDGSWKSTFAADIGNTIYREHPAPGPAAEAFSLHERLFSRPTLDRGRRALWTYVEQLFDCNPWLEGRRLEHLPALIDDHRFKAALDEERKTPEGARFFRNFRMKKDAAGEALPEIFGAGFEAGSAEDRLGAFAGSHRWNARVMARCLAQLGSTKVSCREALIAAGVTVQRDPVQGYIVKGLV